MNRFLLLLALVPALTMADVYRWVDADGTVHFTDTPREGAERVHVPPPQTYTAPKLPPVTPRVEEPEPPVEYTRFELIAPEPDATIRDNTGALTASFALDPKLKANKGHRLVVLLDGKSVQKSKSVTVNLDNVERGEHSLQGQVVDGRGKVLMSSQAITVYMHRQSALSPTRPQPAPPPATPKAK